MTITANWLIVAVVLAQAWPLQSHASAEPSLEDTMQFISEMTVNKARVAVPWMGMEPGTIKTVRMDQNRLTIFYVKTSYDTREVVINFEEVDSIGSGTKTKDTNYGLRKGDNVVDFYCKEGSKCAAYFSDMSKTHWFSSWAELSVDSQSDATRISKALNHLMEIARVSVKPSPF